MLEKEFEYFKKNQEELVKLHLNKFIVIVGETVIGTYDTEQEAYDSAKEKFPIGDFLIQQCIPGKGAYTQTFHTRISIA